MPEQALARFSHHRDFYFGKIDTAVGERGVEMTHEYPRHKKVTPKRQAALMRRNLGRTRRWATFILIPATLSA